MWLFAWKFLVYLFEMKSLLKKIPKIFDLPLDKQQQLVL